MRIALLALTAALAGAPVRAQAQAPPPSPPPEQPMPPVDATPAEPDAATPEKKPATAGASPDGFVIQSDGGDYRLQLRAYAQFDGRFYPGDDEGSATNTFLLRRVRPILQGTVAQHFEFAVAPDFGGGTTVLQDAYLDARYSPKARVRVGKFKPPIGLERLQSATNIAFVERAFPTSLVPNRDVGVQLHGELGGGVVAYAIAVFEGAPDGGSVDLDTNDGKDLAGRVFLSPFKKGTSPLKDLGFGIGGSVGDQSGAPPSYRSGGQLTIVSYATGAAADGRRTRIVPQLSLYSGPLGLMAEYARASALVTPSGGPRTEVVTQAWQATATWTLSGEPASFTGVRPANPFDPSQGHWGALELAARVNHFEIGDDAITTGLIDPTRSVEEAFAWAVGVNWYLNRNVKQVVSFERTTFERGAAAGADRPGENALFFRTQLSF